MNILLFEHSELGHALVPGDWRFSHIMEILKAKPGDVLKGGIVNGPLLEITLTNIEKNEISYEYKELSQQAPKCYPLTLIIGTPRPPTARRLLKDLTSMGVEKLIFTGTDLNEKSYLSSKLWSKGEYHKALLEGAQQAGSTLLPWIERYYSLKKSLESLPEGIEGIFLDIQANIPSLKDYLVHANPGPRVIALGPERGWTPRETEMLGDFGLHPVHMGDRILRTETAALSSAQMVIQHFYL